MHWSAIQTLENNIENNNYPSKGGTRSPEVSNTFIVINRKEVICTKKLNAKYILTYFDTKNLRLQKKIEIGNGK